VARGEKTGAVVGILAKAREKQIPVKEADRVKLDFLSGSAPHQGIIALAAAKEYSTVEDILAYAAEKGEPPFLVILDELEDPHNLGAIIRTAECAGAHGVIIPKRRSVGLSYTVGKASAGAVEYMRVARVTNIATLLDDLKKQGVWIYGADMNGTDYTKCDMSGACALVIGNEGKGMARLVREKCDVIVSLPMKGHINSLNASVAAGILMYHALKSRS
jgi:23S rRNA (guanosine2251-2'-O)-methyltransferase